MRCFVKEGEGFEFESFQAALTVVIRSFFLSSGRNHIGFGYKRNQWANCLYLSVARGTSESMSVITIQMNAAEDIGSSQMADGGKETHCMGQNRKRNLFKIL